MPSTSHIAPYPVFFFFLSFLPLSSTLLWIVKTEVHFAASAVCTPRDLFSAFCLFFYFYSSAFLGVVNDHEERRRLMHLHLQPSWTAVKKYSFVYFYVLLTVHLSTILEINQLNAQFLVL